jgi:hypothetical protein
MPLWKEKVLQPFRRLSLKGKKDKSNRTKTTIDSDVKKTETNQTKASRSSSRASSNSSHSSHRAHNKHSEKAEGSSNVTRQHSASAPIKPGEWTKVVGGEKDPVSYVLIK